MSREIFFLGFLIFAFSVSAQNNRLPLVKQPVFKKDSVYIIKYGAKAGGIILNTTAINNAINDCNKKGGGIVVIPAGFWLTGPIELKSNVNLRLQKNALLQFTKDLSQYKLVSGNLEGFAQMTNQSPLSATNAVNIAITGYGIIDGNGDAWRMVKKDKLTETYWKKLVALGGVLSEDKKTWYPSEKSLKGSTLKNPGEITPNKTPEFYESVKKFLRPNLLVFTRCDESLIVAIQFSEKMRKTGFIIALMFVFVASKAQSKSYAAEMAKTVMTIWKDSLSSGRPGRWSYDQSVILKGIEGLWRATGERKYFDYIQKSMDFFVDDNGNIRTYDQKDFNIDNVACGRNVLLLSNVTGKEKYLKAAQTLRQQLQEQPRTNEGGFWHKKIYPYQMWLDGLYMGEPFYAEYAKTFHEDTAFNDIARQFILMEKNSVDKKTGLMYHGYDESRQQKWAGKTTGRSPNFWGRAMGWYGMGLVDVLESFPLNHPKRNELIQILNNHAKAVTKVQDAKTGLWWDILDMPENTKNYLEASASSMLVYALAKAVRLGYLPRSYLTVAKKGYDGILKRFIKEENGSTNLYGTVSVSGLGGNPYRDGSFDYYMSEKVVVNDPKGVGAFIQAANEIEMVPTLSYGKGKTVLLDNFFNNEWRKDATGKNIRFHYLWDDRMNSGFATLGDIFHSYGVQTKSLETAPTAKDLKGAYIYIIVDPDTEKETATPNYMNDAYANAIADWVKTGGVLILMTNDKNNADLEHTNILAEKFGVRFNYDLFNTVEGDKFEQAAVMVPANSSVFKTAKKVYLKEVSTLQVNAPATVVLTKEGKNMVAVAKYGKGSVFIVGDPWIYDEYADGRRLTADFDNFNAAQDIVKWAIDQSKKK